MAAQPLSLDEIVAKAVAKAPGEIEKAGTQLEEVEEQEVELVAPPEKKPAEKKEVAAEDESLGLSKDQQKQAVQLFAALNDPSKAPVILEFFAKQAGFQKPPEDKKEVKEQKKGLVDDLKEALGPELEYLADKMGPRIEAFLNSKLEESLKPLNSRIETSELEKHEAAAEIATNNVAKKYFEDGKLPDDLASEVNKVLEVFQMQKGSTMESHLEEALILAASRKGVTLQKRTLQSMKRIEKNRNDVGSRLSASDGSRQPVPGEKALNPQLQGRLSLDDAVRQGVEQAKLEMEK